jgi:hypothetical protein
MRRTQRILAGISGHGWINRNGVRCFLGHFRFLAKFSNGIHVYKSSSTILLQIHVLGWKWCWRMNAGKCPTTLELGICICLVTWCSSQTLWYDCILTWYHTVQWDALRIFVFSGFIQCILMTLICSVIDGLGHLESPASSSVSLTTCVFMCTCVGVCTCACMIC